MGLSPSQRKEIRALTPKASKRCHGEEVRGRGKEVIPGRDQNVEKGD